MTTTLPDPLLWLQRSAEYHANAGNRQQYMRFRAAADEMQRLREIEDAAEDHPDD